MAHYKDGGHPGLPGTRWRWANVGKTNALAPLKKPAHQGHAGGGLDDGGGGGHVPLARGRQHVGADVLRSRASPQRLLAGCG